MAFSPMTPSAARGSNGSAARRRATAYDADIQSTLDALAAHLEAHIDVDRLLRLAR